MRRALVALLALMAFAPQSLAQTAKFDDPEADILSDVIAVAPSYGPAWWRVSKGDAVVWIMGLAPANTPRNLNWDKRTVERRINGARLFIGTPEATTRFTGRWEETLAMAMQARVAMAAAEAGLRSDGYWPPTLMSVVALRSDFQKKNKFGLDVEGQMLALAKRARVRVSKPPTSKFEHSQQTLNQYEDEVSVCLSALLDEVETDPAALSAPATYWAHGRVAEVIAAPRDAWAVCMNRMTPGYSRRLIETQSEAIAEALKVPGRVVAVAPIRQLVAQEGILARLRAQGFTVADPKQPLAD